MALTGELTSQEVAIGLRIKSSPKDITAKVLFKGGRSKVADWVPSVIMGNIAACL